jgi:hypothetical protein
MLKHMVLKAKITAPKFILSLLLIAIGSALLCLPQYQEALTDIVSWLQTEGLHHSLAIGLAVLFAGIWMFTSCLTVLFTHRIAYTKGPIVCSLKSGLLNQTVRQLWLEYFGRSDLRVSVSLHGNHIHITGEAPQEWDNADQLCSFLSKRLLTYTGYWGDLLIHTSPVVKGSSG